MAKGKMSKVVRFPLSSFQSSTRTWVGFTARLEKMDSRLGLQESLLFLKRVRPTHNYSNTLPIVLEAATNAWPADYCNRWPWKSVRQLCNANMAEWMEVLLCTETLGYLRNILLDGNPDFLYWFDAASAKLLWPLVTILTSKLEPWLWLWILCENKR